MKNKKEKPKQTIQEYRKTGEKTDPNGSYTGNCLNDNEVPTQDADDL